MSSQTIFLPRMTSEPAIPMGVRMGNAFFSSSITGHDPATGRLGDGAEKQFDLAFRNMSALVTEAGLTTDNIAHVTVFIGDASGRQLINKPWLHIFPDEHNRPARKTTTYPLPDGVHVQLQALAIAEAGRQPYENLAAAVSGYRDTHDPRRVSLARDAHHVVARIHVEKERAHGVGRGAAVGADDPEVARVPLEELHLD